MMRRLALALAMAFLPGHASARCEGVVPGQTPQNTAREFVGQTLDEIVERGWIEFAVYEDFPPYSWEDGSDPRGIDIGVGNLIAEALGVTARFRFVQAGDNLEADLFNYVWKGSAIDGRVSNVLLRVPYNSDLVCRIEQVVFTGQYTGEQISIAYALSAYPDAVPVADVTTRHAGAPVPAFFRYDTVGVENDSIADFYLTSTTGADASENIRRYPSVDEAAQALAAGEIMAVMGPLTQLEASLEQGLAVHSPPLPGFSVGRWTLGLAVHQSHRDLAYALDDAVTAGLGDGRIAAIHESYGVTFTPPER